MEKILSVVIPAYNVEKYLNKCLDSFLVPEILPKIEVLVINDGSTDGTEAIARQYCEKYPDTYHVYTKENGGHGSTINYGVQRAAGTYFKVVDGDDWLNTKALLKFIEMLEQQACDIVAADYDCIQDETWKLLQHKKCTQDASQYEKVCRMKNGEVSQVIKMHAMTIKTSILKACPIPIDEHCFYVDAEYITYPVPYVDTVYYYPDTIYMYRLGRNGQSMDIHSMQKRRGQHMHVLNRLLTYYESAIKDGMDESNRAYMEKCIAQMVENQFQIYISMGLQKGIYRELKDWDQKLRQNWPDIYGAAAKKSIDLLRNTNYLLLPAGAIVYKIVKG